MLNFVGISKFVSIPKQYKSLLITYSTYRFTVGKNEKSI